MFFVDDEQIRMTMGAIEPPHQFGVNASLIDRVKRHQVKLLLQYRQGGVLGTIVDDHDLEIVVAESEEGAHALPNCDSFIIGRDQYADTRCHPRAEQVPAALPRHLPSIPQHLPASAQQQYGIHAIDQDKVHEDGPLQTHQDEGSNVRPGDCHTGALGPAMSGKSSMCRAISAAKRSTSCKLTLI